MTIEERDRRVALDMWKRGVLTKAGYFYLRRRAAQGHDVYAYYSGGRHYGTACVWLGGVGRLTAEQWNERSANETSTVPGS